MGLAPLSRKKATSARLPVRSTSRRNRTDVGPVRDREFNQRGPVHLQSERSASFLICWLSSCRRSSSTRLWKPVEIATPSGVFLTSVGTASDLPARIHASTS